MSRTLKQQILPVIGYPLVMMLGLLSQRSLQNAELGLQLSTYIAVIIGVLGIVVLELMIPYRQAWRPELSDLKADMLFVVFVQILLPKILGFLIAISLLESIQSTNTIPSLWPHDAPILMQLLFMMVIAEFLRYWLHRCAHAWSPLWRLHAVHHSPAKLYWLNTGRFHPLEKTIQFLFDALPFILLGVSSEVLSLYFVFYAINGFFQHSNINLRMGFLNYIISSAELHRWHHSKNVDTSGKNYGNNLIIWDTLFGTRYLPKNEDVGSLGLINPTYPMSFIEQIRTPTTPGIDKTPMMLLDLKDIIRNFMTQTGVMIAKLIWRFPFELSLSNPMKHQHKALMKIIKENQHSEYGVEHHFSEIKSWRNYIKNVPIQDYEDLRPYIEKQETTKQPSLTVEQPQYYAITSGTTGQPKLIPVLAKTIKQYQRALAMFACVQNNAKRHTFAGRLLAIPGAYKEGVLNGGTVYGSISGLMYYLMPRYLRSKYVAPNSVFSINDPKLKYRLIIRLAIQHTNLTYMATANPSTFLKLKDILNEEILSYANDLKAGTFSDIHKLSPDIAESVNQYLYKDEKRAQQLRQLALLDRELTFSDVWPNLRLIVTWTGGSCGVAISRLKKIIHKETRIIDLGYLASEMRGSITLEDTGNAGAPTFHDVFYEFIEVNAYEGGKRNLLLLDQLEINKQYYVIITTSSGLYRYFMNDIIEVIGFKKSTALIRFVQKGKGVTNITGEKLTEQQLMAAIEALNVELNLVVPFYICLASVTNNRYELFIEANIDAESYAHYLDQKLRELNNEYDSKRASGRLHQSIVKILQPGTEEHFKAWSLSTGIRESQFKYLLLQYKTDCLFPFEDYVQ